MVDATLRHRLPKLSEQASTASRQKLHSLARDAQPPDAARRNLQALQLYPYWPWERVPRNTAAVHTSRNPRSPLSEGREPPR